MTRDRMNGMIIGVFYIVAAITSIIAVVLYQPVLSEQWYMTVANGHETKVLVGAINDLLLVVTAIGTAVMFFPYLRGWNEHIALGYLCLRFMEAVFIAIGIVSILGLWSISIQYEAGNFTNVDNLSSIGFMLQSLYRWTTLLGPNFMLGLNTVLYSYLLFRTAIVPKPLALFGMITALMVFLAGLLEMFGLVEPYSTVKGLIALPVGVYEISLAFWLIVKGFYKEKLRALKAK
ncbi:DUF4386 domain-containing protein [Bacillus sp. FJAT-49736]|uniref:DUF4386 domain-containing protein n=1 Tax=Bacillus sp. FJAT-49736 TaxID=2833582 RepID=UPI001BC9342B|nr:DUF4386 domain-containing protein [Bacillus sp. FJAT-49736]MBS4175051.1 DUF4386 domain-containing protein [Bacillus sp. FJAT-49736]